LPDKNIRDFCGKPMMAHILDAAKKSRLFDTIHVSTEDPLITDIANSLGLPPEFVRPASLSDDYTPLMPVLRYVTEQFLEQGKKFTEIWLLMACAPLIEAVDLRAAAKLFESHNGERSVMGVAPYPAPVEWAFSRRESGDLDAKQPGMFAKRSQDLEPSYYDAGVFAVFSSKQVLKSKGSGSDSGFVGCILPRDKAIDIDNEKDWVFAEKLFKINHVNLLNAV
jgi:N-acylneuraminate cytidylyltransferase